MDISGASAGWKTGKSNWSKKCCDPSNGYAVIPPPKNLSDEKIKKVNKQIEAMPALKEVILSILTAKCNFTASN